MKLKKIASLMLAGVMAVSMLAGCSGKDGDSGNDGNKPIVTSGVDAAGVIAKLDKDTTKKVEFSASSSLQSALTVYVDALGDSALDKGAVTDGYNIGYLAWIADLDIVGNFTDDDAAETRLFAGVLPADVSDTYAVRMIAGRLDEYIASLDLRDSSIDDDTNIKDGQEYTKYDYTGSVAVVKVEGTLGQNGYVYAYTITRTPSDAKVEL